MFSKCWFYISRSSSYNNRYAMRTKIIKIVDLSGNTSFYVTTFLGLGNYSFLAQNNPGGANVLAKIQLTTSVTGVEYYNNLTQFKSRFYDKNITQ